MTAPEPSELIVPPEVAEVPVILLIDAVVKTGDSPFLHEIFRNMSNRRSVIPAMKPSCPDLFNELTILFILISFYLCLS